MTHNFKEFIIEQQRKIAQKLLILKEDFSHQKTELLRAHNEVLNSYREEMKRKALLEAELELEEVLNEVRNEILESIYRVMFDEFKVHLTEGNKRILKKNSLKLINTLTKA